MIRVEYVLDSWKPVRQDTIAAVEDFPASEFDYRPAADVMTFGETARHILAAGTALSKFLLAGVEDFSSPVLREEMKAQWAAIPEHPTQEWLGKELRQSMEQMIPQLAAQPPEFYAGIITRMDRAHITRLEMVQSIKEHEMVHRAQLFFCLRMKGIVPATTRRRMAQQASR